MAFGLGANVGDAAGALQGALDVLASVPGLRLVAVSSVFDTEPVGGPEQPRYLNAVVVAETTLGARDLLAAAHLAEQAHGRTRDVRWGPRTLDVDVLAVEGVHSDDPVVTLPHPRAHERAFVLVPWAQVDPGAAVGEHGTVGALASGLTDSSEVRCRDDLALALPAPRADAVGDGPA